MKTLPVLLRPALFCLVLLCMVLAGCGTTYRVSVDTLRAPDIPPEYIAAPLCFVPGNVATAPDDLLFLDVTSMLRPVFEAHQYTVLDAPDTPDPQGKLGKPDREAALRVRVSYSEGEPVTVVTTGVQYRQQPVFYRGRTRYVTVEEPTINTYTTYNAQMLLEAFANTPQGAPGRQLWRIALKSSSADDNFRQLLSSMMPALNEALSAPGAGLQRYDVTRRDKGQASVQQAE